MRFKDAEDEKAFNNMLMAFTNNGDVNGEEVKLSDLLTSPDVTRFIPQVVQNVVREALEPATLIVPNLFQEIRMERGTQIQIGAVGALAASEVAEGTEYKEAMFDLDGGDMVAITISKHGLMIRVTDEMISDNQFDVINLWLRAAGRALARHKEQYALRLINQMGYDIFDNTSPSTSFLGTTTGRDITGAQNGTMTTNDIFDLYIYLWLRGFQPDTVIMHPLAWKVFMTDAEMREVVLAGATLASRRVPDGQTAPAWGTSHSGSGLRTTATGTETIDAPAAGSEKIGANAFTQNLNALGSTYNIAPRFLPTPLRVLVTPYLAYSSPSLTTVARTNVIMTDSSMAGILVTRDPVSTEEFDDPARDIRALKIRERYGFGLLEQGKSFATARNVAVDRNYNFENMNSVTLSALTANVAV